MTITLIYPAFYSSQPHVAELEAEVRLTPTQIVLVKPLFPIRLVNGYTRGPSGIGSDKRWHRKNGLEVGYIHSRGWRPSAESLEKCREAVPCPS